MLFIGAATTGKDAVRMITVIVMIIGVPMSIIAAVMAFITTYEKYSPHYTDKRMAIKHGLETALATLLIFLLMLLILSFAMSKIPLIQMTE
jgi:hypothetical protein